VRVKVLVVDDNRGIREGLAEVFAVVGGFQVLEAEGVLQALEVLRRERPDAILLDLVMQGVSGQALLTYLELMPGLSDIPVVVMSAARSVAAPGRVVLEKPFAVEHLLEALRAAADPERRERATPAPSRG
jgi:two-component system, OmpR family, response regulator MprA